MPPPSKTTCPSQKSQGSTKRVRRRLPRNQQQKEASLSVPTATLKRRDRRRSPTVTLKRCDRRRLPMATLKRRVGANGGSWMVVGSKECEGSLVWFGVGISVGWSRRWFGVGFGTAMVYLQQLSSTATAEALLLSLIEMAELNGNGGWSRQWFGV